jgi:hypothetical protein
MEKELQIVRETLQKPRLGFRADTMLESQGRNYERCAKSKNLLSAQRYRKTFVDRGPRRSTKHVTSFVSRGKFKPLKGSTAVKLMKYHVTSP